MGYTDHTPPERDIHDCFTERIRCSQPPRFRKTLTEVASLADTPKALTQLSQALQDGVYTAAVKQLNADEVAALHALVAAGGWLPTLHFTHHFGEIRPYRPWRRDFAPRHPWRYPVSAAERLYQLGMIHLDE